ncbi:MAG: hypothetical protein ACT4N1_07105, partial [Nitrososphaerota archaeon]
MKKSDLILDLRTMIQEPQQVFLDEPLILSVFIKNWQASTAYSSNTYFESEKAHILEFVKQQKRGKEKTKKISFPERKKEKTSVYKIGSLQKPWINNIRFYFLKNEKWHGLKWPLKPLFHAPKNKIVLNHKSTAYAEFDLEKPKSAGIKPNSYTIKAVLSIPNVTAESNPLTLNLVDKTDTIPSEAKLEAFARYYLKKKMTKKAESISKHILEAYPDSINGLIIKGEIFESLGKL